MHNLQHRNLIIRRAGCKYYFKKTLPMKTILTTGNCFLVTWDNIWFGKEKNSLSINGHFLRCCSTCYLFTCNTRVK